MMFSFYRYFLTALEAILQMMLKIVLKPLFVKYVIFYLKVSNVDSSLKCLTDFARISLDDQSYSTRMSVFSYIGLIGDFPVKSA